ncbi:MAG: M15 family metallopeptidase [Chloroflexota bacterium]
MTERQPPQPRGSRRPLFLAAWLALTCAALLTLTVSHPAHAAPPRLSPLAVWLLTDPRAVERGLEGTAVAVFSVPVNEARLVFMPVSRERPLPSGYEPPDLRPVEGRLVRELIVADLKAMMLAAEHDRVDLTMISTYRSAAEQARIHDDAVWRAMARLPQGGDQTEATVRASRFVAPPGHSQHQLGTAIDFSTYEIGYGVRGTFADTRAGTWLADHAASFGFVLSYPPDAESKTGYAYEPWHWRWVGRALALAIEGDPLREVRPLVVDDYLRAIEEIMDAEGLP